MQGKNKMNKIEYLGYMVCENGDVYNRHGKKMKKTIGKTSKTESYCITINKRVRLIPVRRFVYQAFNQNRDLRGYIVKSKTNSDHIDDLYLIKLNDTKISDFRKMRSKKAIFDKLIETKKTGEVDKIYNILYWVLGGK